MPCLLYPPAPSHTLNIFCTQIAGFGAGQGLLDLYAGSGLRAAMAGWYGCSSLSVDIREEVQEDLRGKYAAMQRKDPVCPAWTLCDRQEKRARCITPDFELCRSL
jgi:hypothetical protein